MFSRRLTWPYPPNRLSRLLDEARARGRCLLDLTESNPTRAGLPYPAEAIAAALADPGAATYDPSPRGLASARAAVSVPYRRCWRPTASRRRASRLSTRANACSSKQR